MAKHLDKFTRPFQNSAIPFALAEVLTNGRGEMVDVVCRFLNPAAGELLQIPAQEAQGRRLSQLGAAVSLEALSPLQAVAFSGSSASFSCETAGGQALSVTCYQVMYGVVGCLLDRGVAGPTPLPEAVPAAVLELGRGGLRCSACNREFCRLTGQSQKTLLGREADTFSSLVLPEDWPALLQALLDAAREGRNGGPGFPAAAGGRLRRLGEFAGGAPLLPAGGRGLSGPVCGCGPAPPAGGGAAGLPGPAGGRPAAGGGPAGPPAGGLLPAAPPPGRRDGGPAGQPGPVPAAGALRRMLLAARLAEDPGGFVPAGQREELLAAAVRARECRLPLRPDLPGGSPAQGRSWSLSVHVVWEAQPDGSLAGLRHLFRCLPGGGRGPGVTASGPSCATCCWSTPLSSPWTMSPAADLAQIQRHSPGGRRTSRTISGYLKSLSTAPYPPPGGPPAAGGRHPPGPHPSRHHLLLLSGGLRGHRLAAVSGVLDEPVR